MHYYKYHTLYRIYLYKMHVASCFKTVGLVVLKRQGVQYVCYMLNCLRVVFGTARTRKLYRDPVAVAVRSS